MHFRVYGYPVRDPPNVQNVSLGVRGPCAYYPHRSTRRVAVPTVEAGTKPQGVKDTPISAHMFPGTFGLRGRPACQTLNDQKVFLSVAHFSQLAQTILSDFQLKASKPWMASALLGQQRRSHIMLCVCICVSVSVCLSAPKAAKAEKGRPRKPGQPVAAQKPGQPVAA